MAGITITASGGASERLRRIRTRGLGLALKQFGSVAENVVTNALRSEAPEGKGGGARVPGTFRSSIRGSMTSTGDRVTLKFDAEQPLATWIIKGTKAHVIFGNPILAWEDGGAVRFAAHVQHPGTKPNPFQERAVRRIRDELLDILAASVKANWE